MNKINISVIKEASNYIREKISMKPEISLILGSGLGVLAEDIENPTIIPYDEIPHFLESTVTGHAGQLVFGTLKGRNVMAMQGRFHYYEGYSMQEVTFPVRVMKELGVKSIIVTNAAGGVNKQYNPGDLMLISDHINNMGSNPLIGPNDDSFGPRFPDMTEIYDKEYISHAEKCAKDIGVSVQKGVYVGNTGPTYETAAEVNMLRILGGDAVGMSTVPEVTVARHANIRVLGISCISNMAAGILDQPLTHDEVMETTNKVKGEFINLVEKIIHTLPK